MDAAFYEDTIGAPQRMGQSYLSSREELSIELREALIKYFGKDVLLSPPQERALDAGVAGRNGSDFLITAPTNSGKTLISIFRIFTAALCGQRRCVYVAPLKALAEEKAIEFRAITQYLKTPDGKPIQITVTTGDYQISRDFLGSAPPEEGEIVICTPERLEVMLRNPENHEWARAVDTFVFDEFHLLGDVTRGGAVETLVTRILVSCEWTSLVLLSATIGDPAQLLGWLSHTGRKFLHLQSEYRFPELRRRICLTEDIHGCLEDWISVLCSDPTRSALVFVSTRSESSVLAQAWQTKYPNLKFAAFHAGLTTGERNRILVEARNGGFKAIATTSSLKMGVNFPVTDVLIRDSMLRSKVGTFPLSASDVFQMMGRAGRGEVPGGACLLVADKEQAVERRNHFESGFIEELKPRLLPRKISRNRDSLKVGYSIRPINALTLTQIVVLGRASIEEVSEFTKHTFSAFVGGLEGGQIPEAFDFLLQNHLIEPIEGTAGLYKPRALGRTVSLCGISPESGAILAGMLRALIKLQKKEMEKTGKKEDLINRLTDLDLLFLASSAFECRDHWLKKSDLPALGEVQSYIESLPFEGKPLFNRWRDEESPINPTRRLLSSLKVDLANQANGTAGDCFARIMGTAILLHRHAKGESTSALSARYSSNKRRLHEGDFESGLKFTITWVLSCLSQLCDPEKAYDMKGLKMKILGLIEDVSMGSEMGKLTNLPGIGLGTVRKLMASGVQSMETLRTARDADFQRVGLTQNQVSTICKWVRAKQR